MYQKQHSLPLILDIQNPLDVLVQAKKLQQYFHVKEFNVPKSQARMIIIKIGLEGREEQKMFEINPQFIEIYRRGLTILFGNLQEKYFDINNRANYQLIRKGLPKFYELDNNWENPQQRNQFLYNNQLQSAYQSLELKIPVTLIEQQQENGDNCQISYSQTLNCWVISSKNYSLLFKDEKDLQGFSERLPVQIAELWFKYIKEVDQENLKQDLQGKTLIGEYVNNPYFNHFVSYPQASIIFFAIVENQSNKFCCHTQTAEYLANKYHLNFVQTKYIQIEDKYYLDYHIKRIQEQVEQKPISIQGEGAVLYLFNAFECLSIFKIKSIEYKQHKLFRTTLMNVFRDGFLCVQSPMDSYEQEAKDMNIYHDRDIDKLIETNKIFLLHILNYLSSINFRKDQFFNKTMTDFVGKQYYTFYSQINQIAQEIDVNEENIFQKFVYNQKMQQKVQN